MTLKEEAARFKPVDIDRLSENDDTVTEAMRMACVQYNSALRELAGGSAGAARSQLRKAVALYPEFDHAVILYGICTFYMGDRTGAMRIFNSVKTSRERVKAMRIYDRLASEESSRDSEGLDTARKRTFIDTDQAPLDRVYLKKLNQTEEEPALNVKARSLFIDGEAGFSGGSSVKVSTSGWSKSSGEDDRPGETGRRRTTVTVSRIPELEENSGKPDMNPILAVACAALLLAAIALAIALVVTGIKNRSLKRQIEQYRNETVSFCSEPFAETRKDGAELTV